jgi:hypothetical protein
MIRGLAVAIVAAIAIWSAGAVERAAFAHGIEDQTLSGDTVCTANNFPLEVPVADEPRQEFVPSGTLVTAIEMCGGSSINTTIDILIREGSAEHPGEILAVKTVPISIIGAWLSHADFIVPVPVKAGKRYVIEIHAPTGVFWRGSDVDRYPAGKSNVTSGDLQFTSFIEVGSQAAPTADDGGGSSWTWVWVATAIGLGLLIVVAGGVAGWRWRARR